MSMSTTRITREQCVAQSLEEFVISALTAASYPLGNGPGLITVMDSFPDDSMDLDLDRDFIALGIADDDGGSRIEMGSDLIERNYIFEAHVVGQTGTSAANLAHRIRQLLDTAGIVPLVDYRLPGDPVVDQLQFEEISVDRNEIDEPKPWQRNHWIATVPIIDTFYASAA
jgi:hypothetical protein